MDYQCLFSARDHGWVVEAIDFDKDGEVYRALFTGPAAEQRAKEYTEWKLAVVSSPQRQSQLRRSAA